MERAYRLAAAAVRRRFAEQHPDYLDRLSRLSRSDIAVYSGAYDQVGRVLECLGLPAVTDPEPKNLPARIAFVNCSGHYQKDIAGAAAAFVAGGGMLVSSDWGLDQVLEKAFPGVLAWNRRSTGTDVISVEPYLDSVWSEVVVLGADPQWWLWGSHPIEVKDPERVRIEAASHDLLVQHNAPVVAARFSWEQGEVFHVISHFWARSSATPTLRHRGPGVDFLRTGMRLSEDGIAAVLGETKLAGDDVSFAVLQSAATATELVAQCCVRAVPNTQEQRTDPGNTRCPPNTPNLC